MGTETTEERLRALRVSIASANPTLPMADVDRRAQDIVDHESHLELMADLEAYVAASEADREARREHLESVYRDGMNTDQTFEELVEELKTADDAGEGWSRKRQ